VAGDGPLLAPLSELAAELRIAPFVHLLGARADVPEVLSAMDVFVLSSSTEGLPLVIPEAMAIGLPVVATSVGGIPSVIDEGLTGLLVPSGDEPALRDRLAALRSDPAAAHAIGARARSAATSRFSADRMHRDYVELYERVLDPPGGRGRRAGRT
jgi:glycosyltransferase involved in cell wall biosynthesis